MADLNTTNYSFVKPEVGASEDTWGAKLNANWDSVDAQVKTVADAAAAAQASADAAQSSANTALAKDPTLTLSGDVTGTATFTNLGNATLVTTIADDSHNHTIANIDGLQTALNGKQAAGTYNTVIGTDTDINTSGATIIDNIYVTDGVITSMGTRVLTAADLGALTSISAGAGIDVSGTTISIETDLREGTGDRYWGNTSDFVFADASVGLRFYTAGAEDMRLTDAGDLHVDGNITAYSTTVSDERLKTDIKTLENPMDILNGLKGVTFAYKNDGKQSAGVIAQDVEKVLPSAVSEMKLPLKADDDSEYKVVEYDQLHAVLIEAVKELQERIKVLEAK